MTGKPRLVRGVPERVQRRLERVLHDALCNRAGYRQAVDIVQKNCQGSVWLVGGMVYRTLIQEFYGLPTIAKDFDFIADGVRSPLQIPAGWRVTKNKHQNDKLINGSLIIDLFPLDNIHSIRTQNLEPTIEGYLRGVPFTIQSLAWNLMTHRLLNVVGIQSLLHRVVGINNQDEYDYAKSVYGPRYSVEKCAADLGFRKDGQ